MAAIKTNFGAGGRNIAPHGQGTPTLATALRDIADDLADMQTVAIASPDASDLASVILLANEIKAALNTIAAVTILTTKG